MAISIVVGLQGAGKSYYAVAEIWKHIKKMHAAEISNEPYKYKKIYTNIEGFIPNRYVEHLKFGDLENVWKWENEQYKAFENISTPHELPKINFTIKKTKDKQIKQEFDPFDDEEIELHQLDDIEIISADDEKIFKAIMNKKSEEIQSDYINFTRPFFEKAGFTECLIVIDESHNHFPKSLSGALKRLASYHRHYDQDYILITQDLNQLPRYITNLTVFTIKATSPAIRVKSDIFAYKVYSGGYISFRDDNKLETKRLKANPYIFGLYKSGSVKIPRSSMYKFFIMISLILALFGGLFYWTKTNYGGHKTTVKVIKRKEIKIPKQTPNKAKLTRVEFTKVKNNIFIKNKRINFIVFTSQLNKQDKFLYSIKQLDGSYKYVYMLTDTTLDALGLPRKKELKKQENNFSPNPFGDGSPLRNKY